VELLQRPGQKRFNKLLLLMLFFGLLILLAALMVGLRLWAQLVSANAHLARIELQLTDLQQTAGLLDDRLSEGFLRIPEIERGILAVEEECARVRGHVAGIEVSVEQIERDSCG
jgi:hypothetical protein